MQQGKVFDRIFNILNTMFLVIVFILVLYPLIFVVSASISDPVLVNQGKVWLLPKGITFEGYARVFSNSEIWTGYRNTIFYTIAGTVISLVTTLMGAYALSRRDLAGRNILMLIFTFTMFFNGGLIPTYILVNNLNMINTVWAMIIPNAIAIYNVIIARTYMQNNIPMELQEAALIDGSSNTRLFFSIVLPLSAPIVAVLALYYGIAQWNSFFNALIYITNREMFPLQLILREILVQNQMNAQMMSAGTDLESMAAQGKIAELIKYAVIIVSTLPVLIIYPFIQKYFTQGIMIGALKG